MCSGLVYIISTSSVSVVLSCPLAGVVQNPIHNNITKGFARSLYSQVMSLILGEFRQDVNLKSNGINKRKW